MTGNKTSDVQMADSLASTYHALTREIGKVIIGQEEVIRNVLISIFCDGHSLLVGVPGLAKTLLVKTIADVLDLTFKRIQFTPDLMPSDITGSEILDENRHFIFNRGPVFANIILADEINRTPPKTQAALLEAMQERAVTAAGHAHLLELPFFVLATQNPIEQEGTYPLPEAQLDRFMFNIIMDYPTREQEVEVVRTTTSEVTARPGKVMGRPEILAFQQLIRKVPVPENVLQYAVNLAASTRPGSGNGMVSDYLSWGAGPRASQFLVLGAKCHAVINGKYSPDIEDVKAIAAPVLRHRLVLNYKAEAERVMADDIVSRLI